MIKIRIRLDRNGCIALLSARGHAGGALKGSNVICAGATTLIRTIARFLEVEDGIDIRGNAAKPGILNLKIRNYSLDKSERIKGITDFLLFGLKDLEKEYPGEFTISIEKQ